MIKYTVLVLLLMLLTGCITTNRQLLKLENSRLTAEQSQLVGLKEWFDSSPNPEYEYDASLFVSQDLINSILGTADNLTLELPEIDNAKLVLHSVRTEFQDGFPYVRISATAVREKKFIFPRLEFEFEFLALSEIIFDETNHTFMSRIHVIEAIPKGKFLFIRLDKFLFLRRLLAIEIDRYAKLMPEYPIPANQLFSVSLPSQTNRSIVPTRDGSITIESTIPEWNGAWSIKTEEVVSLRDGFHIYISISGEDL